MPQKCCTFQQLFYNLSWTRLLSAFKRNGRDGELDFNVIPLKEVRNPEFFASGYLILFCPPNLLKCMILHPKS